MLADVGQSVSPLSVHGHISKTKRHKFVISVEHYYEVVTFGRLAVSDSELGVDVIDFDECYCYLFTVLYCSLVLHAGPF